VADFRLGTTLVFSRRALLMGLSVIALDLAGCATTSAPRQSREVDPAYRRKVVTYDTREAPGTIVVDPANHFLYAVESGGQAMRYGVGVGGEGFGWSGLATVHSKQEWPDWYPPKEMLERRPDLQPVVRELQSGLGVPGGPENPLAARAMYLWQGNKDTLYRIHGTNEPWTIGQNVSAGCIRMTNEDVVDLYDRTALGTKVVVLPALNS
jgi:lipoprotein-anchoring transpeptidase ErfK/SrfK